MCKVFGFNHKPTKTRQNNNELDPKILKVYYDSKRLYSAPKIFKVLYNEGENANLTRIQRRMTVLSIKSVILKKYKPVKAEKNIEQKENILNQDFSTTTINQKWCTNITYIHTEK